MLLAYGGEDQIVVYVDLAPGRSAVGTFRTWRDVRLESAVRGKAEVGLRDRQVS